MSNYPPPYQQYPAVPQSSTTAIISLIAGILGLTAVPILGSIVAVVAGHIAKGEIARSGGTLGGGTLATIGLILGYVGLGILVLGICGFTLAFLGFCTLPFIIPVNTDSSSLLPLLRALI